MKIRKCYIINALLLFASWGCQVLKEPAAKIMSTSLHTPEIDSLENGKTFPLADFNLQVKDLDGNIINMNDYRGKIIFLNFWATWCLPCVAELPSINKLYKELEGENIAFLLISNEESEKVIRYHQKKKYEVPFHIIDDQGFIPQQYFSKSIPTTFIINKDGRIVKSSIGAENWDEDKFIQTIKKML